MLKNLRNKIQSLTQTQQNIITIILLFINIAIIIFWINFWFGLKKITPPKITEQPKQQIEEIPEALKPGEVGELKPGESPTIPFQPPVISPVIFNTGGAVKEIQKDRIVIQGNGSNFADQQQRELTLLFVDSTITFDPIKKNQYKGLTGLKVLKLGMIISLEGEENIRGKTEFKVSIINILQ